MAAPSNSRAHSSRPNAPPACWSARASTAPRSRTVEPGGAEFIPLHERHGKPLQLFWTWTSPNLEFATVFVGVLGGRRSSG